MKKLFLSGVSVTACVLAVVSIASATDLALPARPYYKAPPAPLLFSWTGCYIGGHIGAGWDTKATWADLGDGASDNTSYSIAGVIGGAQGGCDYQFASQWVLGFEGAWSGADIRGGGVLPNAVEPSTFESRINSIATLTGRLGFVPVDRWLVYFKGGGAWARETHTLTEFVEGAVAVDVTRSGYTVGGGLEWAIATNWTAKIEYDYMNFGSTPILFTNDQAAVDLKLHSFRVGINYRF
jgi:outer membrane immunogenic protein